MSTTTPLLSAGFFGVVALVVAVAAYMVGSGLWIWRAGRRAAAWPTVPGRMLTAAFEPTPRDPAFGMLRVTYAYEVAGTRYTGQTISLGRLANDLVVSGVPERYRPGAAVAVSYDPARPAIAVLETGMPVEAIVFRLVGGPLFIGMGLAMAIAFARG